VTRYADGDRRQLRRPRREQRQRGFDFLQIHPRFPAKGEHLLGEAAMLQGIAVSLRRASTESI